MDLVGACLAFVSVAERGSFTLGASAAGVPQPVASRRVAALEAHLGERLFDRGTRRAVLTPFGRDVLPAAQHLVRLAEALEQRARQARRRPLPLAVPDWCPARDLAHLAARAQADELTLELRRAGPAERAALARTGEVRAAITAVPPGEGDWVVPLGVAAAVPPAEHTTYLDTLRVGRSGGAARRVLLQPEDDVPHVRDPLLRLRDALGLRPGQVVVADSLVGAVADVLGSADLLLCSPAQADDLGLHWRPLGEAEPARGYAVAAARADDAERVRALGRDLARCLGAPA
ncbi:LysR family transcriptional regulator [Actinosynnema pretiosum]|uniref:LysR family transcriptional regulator n=1 Tax=Actinosynnema pretiosum TaxID=42197 RepID=A0A290Z8E8_9PSEU|nr:LysR family transcriptional regulator [Actinosynnema pretiosum]ATE55252.1 LysR family transcriptional regulator [Actinosynnema pretiosum]